MNSPEKLPKDSFEDRFSESQAFFKFAYEQFGSNSTFSKLVGELRPRCSRCLLNDAASTLTNELCASCLAPDSEASSRQELAQMNSELDALFTNYSGKGEYGYDAILMYSGGKDSAYLLHELQRLYPKLRMRALMIQNGFASEVALSNIQYTFKRVDVAHEIFTPERSLYRKLFRHCLNNFESRGGYETIDRADGDLLFDIAKNIAAREHVPLIVAGLSRPQCEDILQLDSYELPPRIMNSKRVEIAGFSLTDIYDKPDYRFWWDGTNPPNGLRPKVVFPFYSWEYDESRVREQVASLGLLPETQVDPIITNHKLIPVILALDYLRLGYSTFEPEFSKLVRRGLADRATWLPIFQGLEYLVPRGKFMPRSIRATIEQLNLLPEDLGMPLA